METKFNGAEFQIKNLTNKDLPTFSKVHIKRDLRPSLVNKIVNGIKKNQRVLGVVTVNFRDGQLRTIDGNHRMAAIEEYLLEEELNTVQTIFLKFKNLSDEKEKELYLLLNDVAPQNKMDFVQTQCYDTQIYQYLIEKKKHFPFNITLRSSKKINTIPFQHLIEPYLLKDKKCKFRRMHVNEFIAEIKKLNDDDFEKLKKYAAMYVDLFGEPEPDTSLTRHSFLYPYQILFWSALEVTTEDDFFKRMKANYPKYRQKLTELIERKNIGENKHILVYKLLLDCVNAKRAGGQMAKINSVLEG